VAVTQGCDPRHLTLGVVGRHGGSGIASLEHETTGTLAVSIRNTVRRCQGCQLLLAAQQAIGTVTCRTNRLVPFAPSGLCTVLAWGGGRGD
jgi:hypothetical protein